MNLKDRSAELWDSRPTQQELTDDQSEFFNTVLKYDQDLAKQSGDEEAERSRTAEAAAKFAKIQATLGLLNNAMQSLVLARDEFKTLVIDYPENNSYRFGWAKSRGDWAYYRVISRGPSSEVSREWRAALALYEELLEDEPDNKEYRIAWAKVRVDLSSAYSEDNRIQVSVELIRETAETLERHVDDSTDPKMHSVLAAAYEYWGNTEAFARSDLETAAEPWEKSYAIRQALHQKNPADGRTQLSLARSCWTKGVLRAHSGEMDQAEIMTHSLSISMPRNWTNRFPQEEKRSRN